MKIHQCIKPTQSSPRVLLPSCFLRILSTGLDSYTSRGRYRVGSLCSIELVPQVFHMPYVCVYVSAPLLCISSFAIYDLLARVSRLVSSRLVRSYIFELADFQAQLASPERQDSQRVFVMSRSFHITDRWRLDGGEKFGARRVVWPRITLVEAAPRASREGRMVSRRMVVLIQVEVSGREGVG
ncbi:hypothetical protein DL98DRAFT_183500 [Cadophora sp. DSE1049]|nr:hypothetical protein DL98DRAFT_183500 [Cadophora sp. DSE1049]